MHDVISSASFFAPYDREVEPYIRIATGDYHERRAVACRDDVLATYIVSLSHEIIHYRQWVDKGETWEHQVPQMAGRMLREYAKSTRRP